MNLLTELLQLLEAPARVHVNGKLSVIADLIKTKFGDELDGIPMYNKCLIAQVVYTLHARTGMTVAKVIELFLKRYIHAPNDGEGIGFVKGKGITPEKLYHIFDGQTVSMGGKKYRLDIGFTAYQSTAEIVTAIKEGHPVIVPYSIESRFDSGIESHDDEGKYHGSHVDAPEGNVSDEDYRHCVLAVGVDEESEEIIIRDIRDKYLYKGYVKVPFKAFDNYIKTTFSFDVDLTEVRNGRSA